MRVGHREMQRRRAVANRPLSLGQLRRDRSLYHFVYVRACREQRLAGIDVSLTHGKEQRRVPGVERRPEIGPGLDELLDHLDVTICGRPHQRRLPAPAFLRVHVSAPSDERADSRRLAGTRGGHQHGFSAGERRVRIAAGIEQALDHGGVAVHACERKRRHSIAVRRLHAGAGRDQPTRHLEIVVIGSPVQRGRPICLRDVDVRALVDQLANGAAIHPLHRARQRRIRLRARRCGGHVSRPGQRGNSKRENDQQSPRHRIPHPARSTGVISVSIFPVLSANLSSRTPTLSSIVRCRFASGIGSAYLM